MTWRRHIVLGLGTRFQNDYRVGIVRVVKCACTVGVDHGWNLRRAGEYDRVECKQTHSAAFRAACHGGQGLVTSMGRPGMPSHLLSVPNVQRTWIWPAA